MTGPSSNETLERLWDEVPVGSAPMDDIIRGGKAMRRRGRLRAAGGAAALTLAVVAGGTVAANTVFDGISPRPDGDLPAASETPIAPDGKQLVGMGRAVVAVPAEWNAYGLKGCEPAAQATIWFELESSGDLDCPSVAYEDPTVKISPLDSQGGKAAAKFATRPRVVDGVEVFGELARCPEDAFCVGDTAVRLVVVPSEDVAFTISGPMGAHKELDEIADSVRILPEDYTTVPFVEGNNPVTWNAAIADAGLVPDGQLPPCGPNDVCVATPPVRPDPAPGAVVALGSTVTLFGPAATSNPVDLPTSGWEPGGVSQTALGSGRLAVDGRGCVYLAPRDSGLNLGGTEPSGSGDRGARVYWVWPDGYTATVGDDAGLTVYDADGAVIAHGGDQVEAGGGYGSVTAASAHPCLPKVGTDEVFYVQSDVTMVP